MGKFIDLIGKKFGRLTVVAKSGVSKNKHIEWLCVCDCGTKKVVLGLNLSRKGGHTKSCGCYANERAVETNTTHGHANSKTKKQKPTPEYTAWNNIRERCYNKNHASYHTYGGNGVSVCDKWLNSFDSFISDVGRRPSSRHSIDRYPNNKGNYEPGNVRWATDKEQQGNRSNNKWIEFNGVKMIQADWERHLGLSPSKIWRFLNKGKSFDYIYNKYKKNIKQTV